MTWGRSLAIAVDQLLNVVLAPLGVGSGKSDETLSGFWAQTRFEKTVSRLAIKLIEKLDKDHGFDAIEINPKTGESEPHHMGDEYDKRRAAEEAAMIDALIYDYLDDESMTRAEMGFLRLRLREAIRDRAAGEIR